MQLIIDGLDDFIKGLNILDNDVEKECEKFLDNQANKAIAKVKPKTPVGKYTDGRVGGTLRRNWKLSKPKKGTRMISNNTKYGMYVEFPHRTRGGSKVVEGKYMLTTTMSEMENEIEEDLSNLAETLLKKV